MGLALRAALNAPQEGGLSRITWNLFPLFVAAYRDASEKLRTGNRTVAFPLGSFPPALPFEAG
jgi:hypothetical protein